MIEEIEDQLASKDLLELLEKPDHLAKMDEQAKEDLLDKLDLLVFLVKPA